MQTRILQLKISVANALQKYAAELDGIVLNSMLETDQSNDPVVRLQHLRNEKLPAGDILGYKQSNHRLAFNKNGRYGGFLTDTEEAGFYTIEVTASGINPLTGQEIRLCKTHSVLVR